MERGILPSVTEDEINFNAGNQKTDPFATPLESRRASSGGFSSARQQYNLQRTTYYRSRRIIKNENSKPPVFKKNPNEKWLWIIPLIGFLVGLAVTGVLIFMTIHGRVIHNYCSVLNEDFSTGTLNPQIWMQEVQLGGYGNQQFDETTADGTNVYIQDGQLYIKPTLQDESLITKNNVINLTSSGTCTSDALSDCVAKTNITAGTIVNPVKSGRINTKPGATIKYGRVQVEAKLPQGDWLWPAIWMLPVVNTYGPWPASGEIDIIETRGNNHTYSPGGNDVVSSALHWGPDSGNDGYRLTNNFKNGLHSEFGDAFHVYGIEWSEKYLFTYIDTQLLQIFYWDFNLPFWPQGNFPLATTNGTPLIDPWSLTGRAQTPFDQEFYLILNVAVGGQNGWFPDGVDNKPWVDSSPTAKTEFWNARDSWHPTWTPNGQMIVNTVKMWQQCD